MKNRAVWIMLAGRVIIHSAPIAMKAGIKKDATINGMSRAVYRKLRYSHLCSLSRLNARAAKKADILSTA